MAATDREQLLLELVNSARLDPVADALRYITSYAPPTSGDADIQSALSYFGVDGAALQAAFAALTPVAPLAWSDGLATSARAHSQAMITADTQAHTLPGEQGLGARITAAGYTGWNFVGENIFAYAENPLYAHAGFMVDWGSGPGGMQSPAGHRSNIMDAGFREIGVGLLDETNPATGVGPQVITEDFGVRSSGPSVLILGVTYQDLDGDHFYSAGEGRGGMTVVDGAVNAVTPGSGGYTLGVGAGTHAITFSGGLLSQSVTFLTASIAAGSNVKLDIVDGNTLKTSVSGSLTAGGPITHIEGLGTIGLSLTGTDSSETIVGTRGDDTLIGNGGNDVITAGAGNDTVFGGAGSDNIAGGDGNDTLVGNADIFAKEADILDGGAGNDTIYGELTDTITGGAGFDILYAVNAFDWSINLASTSIELFIADFGNDTIDAAAQTAGVEVVASGGNDIVTGSGFADRLWGGTGNDTMNGGAGDDMLFGDVGADKLSGNDGNDILYVDAADTVVDGGAGYDVVYITAGAGMTIAMAAQGIEFVIDLAGGNNAIDATGMTVGANIYTGAGSDTITGSALDDVLWGMGGNDTIAAGAGNDVLVGGTGADVLSPGSGVDRIYMTGGSGGDGAVDRVVLTAGWGSDTVYDFEHGTDKIDLTALHTTFGALTITANGQGAAVVTLGADTLIVAGLAGSLTASDFLF